MFNLILPSYYKYIAIAGLLVGVGGFSFVKGMSYTQDKWDAAISDSKVVVAIVKQKQAEVTTKVVTKYVDKIKTIKEVQYVTKDLPDDCMLSYNFGMLHNAAATNSGTPPTPEGINGEASTIKAVDLASTIVDNYSIYHETAAQLEALQEWVEQQTKVNDNVSMD